MGGEGVNSQWVTRPKSHQVNHGVLFTSDLPVIWNTGYSSMILSTTAGSERQILPRVPVKEGNGRCLMQHLSVDSVKKYSTCFFNSSASPEVAAKASLEAAADHGVTISSTAPDSTCTLEAHSRPMVCKRSTATKSRGLALKSRVACMISGVSFSISPADTRTSLQHEEKQT